MFSDRIEGKWIDAFCETFRRCGVKDGDSAAILSETQSRQLNVHLAELALLRLGAKPFHVVRSTFWYPIGTEDAWNAAQKMDLAKVLTAR